MTFYKGFEINLVEFYHMKPGKKYLISYFNDTLIYEGIFYKYVDTIWDNDHKDIARFKNTYLVIPYEEFIDKFDDVCHNTDKKFYTILSKKKEIQVAMEYRGLNKILQKIIGDETFVWY
jgi:hypothetical protein